MLVRLQDADPGTAGGKAAALGALLRAGFPVPPGFVVIPESPDATEATDATGTTGTTGTTDASGATAAARPDTLPAGSLRDLERQLAAIGSGPVAVRSSASDEDTAGGSGAGRYTTILGARTPAEIAQAVHTCLAVPDRAAPPTNMAVIVQRLIDAESAGIMFTPTHPDDVTRIEASWGLGPTVVGGAVNPDSYRIDRNGRITRSIADKTTRLDRVGSQLESRPVPDADRTRAALDEDTIGGLADYGARIAALFGGPQDIEWAVADGRIWILQARPITAPLPPPAEHHRAAPLTGTPGSRGVATGTARILFGPSDFGRVRAGDILVCPHTDPAWTPLLRIAAGVVTEHGGALSHAAIIAREQRIPAVLAVPEATATIRDGTTITIDGSAGTVSQQQF